ncbi:MAG: hypothetical protein QF535_16725, partial [Anaerolineales bacterium]|nr:hypothetical protein [Anaerolineales bacterium]
VSGNVGIGTTSAKSLLDVVGAVNISGDLLLSTSTQAYNLTHNGANDLVIRSMASGSRSVLNLMSKDSDETDNVQARIFAENTIPGGANAYNFLSLGWETGNDRYEIRAYSGNGGDESDIAFVSDTTDWMVLDASSGNVGIGTTTPSESLTLQSGTSGQPRIFLNNSNADASDAHIKFGKYSSSPADDDDLGTIAFLGHDSGGAELTYALMTAEASDVSDTTEDGRIFFQTRNAGSLDDTLALVSGNVGIGTAAPNSKLTVVGEVNITADLFLGTNLVNSKIESARALFFKTLSTSNEMKFSQGSTEVMRISAGNVGIGTATPGSKLVVAGTVNITSGDLFVNNGGGLVVGHASQVSPGGQNYEFQVLGTGVPDSGMVLAEYSSGTDPPRFNFVKSAATTIGAVGAVEENDNLGIINWWADDGNDISSYAALIEAEIDGAVSENDVPGRLIFGTTSDGGAAPTERMRIDSSGNVGIGTTSPATVLDVQGKANFTGNFSVGQTSNIL